MHYLILLMYFFLPASPGEQRIHSTKDSTEVKADYVLEAGKVKRWKSSHTPSPYAAYVDVISHEGRQFLVMENRQKTSVEFYPWNASSKFFEVRPDSNQLQEKIYMQGFYVASPDSVFILDASNSKLHLLNKEGKLLKTYSWFSEADKAPKSAQGMAGIFSGSPGIRQGQWLHLSSIPFSGSSDLSTFTEGKTNVAINLATGEARYQYGYPSIYRDGKYSLYSSDIKRSLTPDGYFLYSFGPEDSVRLTDLQDRDKAIFAGSSYFKTPPPASPEMGVMAKPQSYGGILYDETNQVYYRMALHGIADLLEAEHGFDEQEISIIILDKDFNKIGESRLPKGKHNFRQWFVGPDGLYISNHHPSQISPDSKEISFTHYKLVSAVKKARN